MTYSQLAKLCGEGNRDAMGELYATFAPRMLRIILRYVTDKTAAEDILHDGFVVIFSRISDLKDTSKLPNWMATVMKNLSLRYLHDLDITELLDNIAEPEPIPPMQEILSLDELNMIINRLPKGYRNVFRLAVLEGKTHREIADILGIEPGTSSSQLHHARMLLQRMIADYKGTILTFLLLIFTFQQFMVHDMPDARTDIKSMSDKLTAITNSVIKADRVPHLANPATRQIQYLTDTANSETSHVQDSISSEDNQSETPSIPIDHNHTSIESVTSIADIRIRESENGIYPLRNGNPSTLSISFSINSGPTQLYSNGRNTSSEPPIFGDSPGASPLPVHKDISHDIPLEIAIMVNRRINERFSFESGVCYTRYRSRAEQTHIHETQTEQYIGIPLHLICRIYTHPRMTVYGFGGSTMHIPLEIDYRTSATQNKERLHPSMQFSIETGIGVQYNVYKGIGIFAEPTAKWHINAPKHHIYYRNHRPFDLSLPIGIRVTLSR